MYKVKVVLIEDESGEELEFIESSFNKKEHAENAYSDTIADLMCIERECHVG